MSRSDWGTTMETHVRDAGPAMRDVSQDGEEYRAVDLVLEEPLPVTTQNSPALRPAFCTTRLLEAGSRIAVKVAKWRIADGDTTRKGRWMVYGVEALRADAFAVGVYDEVDGVLSKATAVIPADVFVEHAVDTWSPSAHPMYEEVARPPWTRLFDPSQVEGPGGDAA